MLPGYKPHRAVDGYLILAACGLFVMVGCHAEVARQGISGTVSWQGKPLAKGVITLYPKGAGDTVGCEIIDGHFTIKQEYGARSGNYRVEIIAFRPTGKSEFDIDQNQRVAIEEQYLPTLFNSDSTLETEIKPGQENVLNFDLKMPS